jgi:hypothetical protein
MRVQEVRPPVESRTRPVPSDWTLADCGRCPSCPVLVTVRNSSRGGRVFGTRDPRMLLRIMRPVVRSGGECPHLYAAGKDAVSGGLPGSFGMSPAV